MRKIKPQARVICLRSDFVGLYLIQAFSEGVCCGYVVRLPVRWP